MSYQRMLIIAGIVLAAACSGPTEPVEIPQVGTVAQADSTRQGSDDAARRGGNGPRLEDR